MNTKNLFLEKFYFFLLNESKFFKENKKLYIINFLQLLKKNYPQLIINEDTKELIGNFYDSLFINPALKSGNFKYLLEMKEFLTLNRIDNKILNKTFLLIANHYIKYIFAQSDIEKLKILSLLIDFYQKFIESHIKEEHILERVPLFLEKLYKSNSTLILFGVYKGIPISNKSKIIEIDKEKNTVLVSANNYQLIAAKFQKEIYLLDTKTNKTFKAYVKDIITYKKTLLLSDIKEIQRDALKRNYIRVQPKQTVNSVIIVNKHNYTGKIYDISVKGVSIISEKNIPLNINDIATVKFKLFTDKEVIFNFSAELRSISKLDDYYRYHFYFEPTPSEEAELEKYITRREKEIIFELTNYLNKEFIEP